MTPPANHRRACWGAACRGEGFGLCQMRRDGGTVGRDTPPYLVFGFPPCGAGSSRASWRRTRSSRLCERSRQNKEVEGIGARRKTHKYRRAKPERTHKGREIQAPASHLLVPNRLGAKLPKLGAVREPRGAEEPHPHFLLHTGGTGRGPSDQRRWPSAGKHRSVGAPRDPGLISAPSVQP